MTFGCFLTLFLEKEVTSCCWDSVSEFRDSCGHRSCWKQMQQRSSEKAQGFFKIFFQEFYVWSQNGYHHP